MPLKIKTLSFALPFHMGSVNSFLVEGERGSILIDTGSSNCRAAITRELECAGCAPGSLKLMLLTHGDFDHIGNAAYLRNQFGAKIAMHADDCGMAERGDMFCNRQKSNFLIRQAAPLLFGFGRSACFQPDLLLDDGFDLSAFEVDARVLSIPGHSMGSIGILTGDHDLFCGDLFENNRRPELNSIMDDPVAARASVEKLRQFEIKTVYPGHGRPFPMALYLKNKPKAT